MSRTPHTNSYFFSTWAPVAIGAALLLPSTNDALAGLVVYEPFDYAPGAELTNLDGGGGFGGDWTGRENNDGNVPGGSTAVQAASLAHPTQPGDLPTAGGHVLITGEFGTSQPARDFGAVAKDALAASSTTWISFLAQRQGRVTDPMNTNWPDNPYPRGVNVSLFREDVAANDELVGVGNSSNAIDNTWSIIPNGSGSSREGAYDPPGGLVGGGPENMGAATFPWNELQWAVIRIDHTAGNDDIYLWLSPDPSTEPNTADADAAVLNTDDNAMEYGALGAIRPFIGNQSGTPGGADFRPFGVLALDEIRVGTAYADMTGTDVIPEPASLVLLVLSGLAAAGLRRRR